ncbi:MAG: fatty acid desaturase [Verrucomicrobiota bacterium]
MKILRNPRRDRALIGLSLVHAPLLLAFPTWWMIGLLFWWNANTVSHNFIHRRFFRPAWLNHVFSVYLTLLLGLPHRVWRDRHLAHHGERPWRCRASKQLVSETLLVSMLYAGILGLAGPAGFGLYMAGLAFGLLLSWLQGHYEHVHGTRSYYGAVYNLLFFNDGYHVEHHLFPGKAWNELKDLKPCTSKIKHASRWPAVLRWLETNMPPDRPTV